MGQIILDIPQNKTLRYKIDGESATAIVAAIKAVGVQVKTNPEKLTKKQLEALQDREDGRRAAENMRKAKRYYTIEEAEKMLGL